VIVPFVDIRGIVHRHHLGFFFFIMVSVVVGYIVHHCWLRFCRAVVIF